ncbi:S1 family peptidase [Carboxylicivirga sp. N1Y90]|uniref:S1 family peptidase n=1 Tax=Carboxylicivirga fragile TaxID=3417571 RepID=UPI003D346FC9|nr:trypsin-like peptidase domain-containing protein [Marinilabiliaceae bacterium N1Y90]
MKEIRFILLALIITQLCSSQESYKTWPAIAMINDVTFKDRKFDKHNIGCGFLLKHEKDTFAITAKHIICVAKTDVMKTTNFEGGLKQWTMYPKDKKDQTVIMGKLLNEDTTDSLSFDFINRHDTTYNDFLIFKIKQNNSKLVPLEIRKTQLKEGEILYAIGWTYNDTEGSQRIYKYSYYQGKGTRFNMRLIDAPANAGGLSGSPVVDTEGLLVGIISGMDEDPITKEAYSSPRNINYLIDFFNNRKH